MRASKKLLLGLAVLAVSVTGIQAEDECKVCRNDLLGLSDECRDVRLDDELSLKVWLGEGWGGIPAVLWRHSGARLQWSTNSVDWQFFNHSRGVGIQPDLSRWTFGNNGNFTIGQPVDLHIIGKINWGAGVYEGPEVTKFFVRLMPCDVNAHLEAYKNRKISIEKEIDYLARKHSGNNLFRADGIRVKVSWNYGVLESTKSIRFPDWRPPRFGAGLDYFSRV